MILRAFPAAVAAATVAGLLWLLWTISNFFLPSSHCANSWLFVCKINLMWVAVIQYARTQTLYIKSVCVCVCVFYVYVCIRAWVCSILLNCCAYIHIHIVEIKINIYSSIPIALTFFEWNIQKQAAKINNSSKTVGAHRMNYWNNASHSWNIRIICEKKNN